MKIRKYQKHLNGEHNLDKVMGDVYKAINGNISYGQQGPNNTIVGQNLAGVYAFVASTGVANTPFTVNHTLNRVPIGFHVIRQNAAGSVFDSGTAWTATQIFLTCSGTNVKLTLFIF